MRRLRPMPQAAVIVPLALAGVLLAAVAWPDLTSAQIIATRPPGGSMSGGAIATRPAAAIAGMNPTAIATRVPGTLNVIDRYDSSSNCKWPTKEVNYFDNTAAQYRVAVVQAASKWNVATGLQLDTYNNRVYNIVILLYNGGDNGGAGYAEVPVYCNDGKFSEIVKIKLNTYYVQAYGSDQLTAAIIHEFGHALGLDHPDVPYPPPSCPVPIMYAELIPNFSNCMITTPQRGDITGIKLLYP